MLTKADSKRCNHCQKVLATDCFNKNRARPDGLQDYCRDCHKAHNAVTYKKHRLKWKETRGEARRVSARKYWRKHNLRRKYGVTEQQADKATEAIGGLCEICGQHCLTRKRLSVDHCHDTGIVRGLLCMKCNIGIGKFNDSVELLLSAIKYLSREDSISMQILNSKEGAGVK
jgi:hypothetical protein